MSTRENKFGGGAAVVRPPGRLFDFSFRLARLGAVLTLCLLCSCSKTAPKPVAYQPANDPDPERAAENQIQLLLTRVNAREMEVAAYIRAAGPGLTPEARLQAGSKRDTFYTPGKYFDALHAAQTAMQNKMTALTTERDILANSKDTNPPAGTLQSLATNAPPDERAEESRLKARLLELQTLTQDLALTSPAPSQVNAQTQEKAAAAREDIYSAEDYVARLGLTVELLQQKLRGLDAEAAVYENLLGLNSNSRATNRH